MGTILQTRKSGFTLTEVLVVVLIVAVLSAVIYPLYTKAITKSRAVEAINLLEMVRNKQLQKYARDSWYYSEFNEMGQLTNNAVNEIELSGGTQLKVKDYTLSLNNATNCMSAKYQKGSTSFTFSTSYEYSGLGCTGAICTSFGDIIGDAKSVCNCGSKQCANGYSLNEDTCKCDCLKSCDQGDICYDAHGGGLTRPCSSGCGTEISSATCNGSVWGGKCWSPTQEQPTSQGCGWNNSGTQTRICSADCGKGTCSAWGPCKNQQCDPSKKPDVSQPCGKNNTGTQTRPVNCNPDTGAWEPGAWGTCTGQVCDDKEKPAASQPCGKNNTGTQTRPITCNSTTGLWETGPWSNCTGQVCDDNEKPILSQACGNCGTQTRTVTCNSNTGSWNTPSAWGMCNGQGVCSPGVTQGCGNNNTGTQTCSASCTWDTCTGERFDCSGSSSQGCGNCGTQTRTCNTANGTWSDWSTCTGQGECRAGATESASCPTGYTGNRSRTCSSSCRWNSWNETSCQKESIQTMCFGGGFASPDACSNSSNRCPSNLYIGAACNNGQIPGPSGNVREYTCCYWVNGGYQWGTFRCGFDMC